MVLLYLEPVTHMAQAVLVTIAAGCRGPDSRAPIVVPPNLVGFRGTKLTARCKLISVEHPAENMHGSQARRMRLLPSSVLPMPWSLPSACSYLTPILLVCNRASRDDHVAPLNGHPDPCLLP
ncbi:hypothetical protein ABBQ38_011647 [Trebouxia sp. C0009 RCD-2024]